jgi:glutamate-1-semialdehyde 2,1-aminomutase
MKTQKSENLFVRAKERIPGGVNSPVRAFKSVGRNPLFISRARGSRMWDVDGNEFIDFVGSWGPAILGHADERVIEAVRKAALDGTSFGAATEREVELAEKIGSMVPSIEMVRLVNSGTEATMSAIRLARAFAGKEKIVKFEGCYHGHADSFLIKAGSGAMTLGVPDSPGVTRATGNDTLTARFNDPESVQQLIDAHPGEIACVIVEPVVGNMGCVPPRQGFLESLRSMCSRHGILLIFDEVMTGFRLAPGGAQQLYHITPDLTTLGKIIGGGLPVGAYGGRREIMSLVAPVGPVYQAGTLSGNPLATAAGLATLRVLSDTPGIYESLEQRSAKLETMLNSILRKHDFRATLNRVASMFTLFFTPTSVVDYSTAKTADTGMFARYFGSMLERGFYLPPSQFEAAFISAAHTESELRTTADAIEQAMLVALRSQ